MYGMYSYKRIKTVIPTRVSVGIHIQIYTYVRIYVLIYVNLLVHICSCMYNVQGILKLSVMSATA